MPYAFASFEGPEPLREMNTTPLIDVMLVLLIMFILTIPIQMHATKIGLPAPGPGAAARERPVHRIDIDVLGTLYWDGRAADAAALSARLAAAGRDDAEIRLKPDAYARYELVNHIIADVQRSGVERIGFIGNEAYAD